MQCFSENLYSRNSVSCVHFQRYLPCVRIDTDVSHSGARLMTSALTVQCEDLLIGEQVDVLTVYEGLLKGEQVDVLTVNDCLLKVEQVDVLTVHEGLFRQAVQADVYTASIWAGGCSICYLRTVQMIFGTSSGTSGRMNTSGTQMKTGRKMKGRKKNEEKTEEINCTRSLGSSFSSHVVFGYDFALM